MSEQTTRAYNALAWARHLDLSIDGYILGIEKYRRHEIQAPPPGEYKRFSLLTNTQSDPLVKQENQIFLRATDDSKPLIVTHIVGFFPERDYIYDSYGEGLQANHDYEQSYAALDQWMDHLGQMVQTGIDRNDPYTHLFITAMGWNNDQYEAIFRFNKIIGNLFPIAVKNNLPFKPLLIGITWPSAWFTIEDSWFKKKIVGHLGSYFNKVDDADEIGFTIMNYVVNHKMPKVKAAVSADHFPKIIALGHSMGARMLSRAIFSGKFLLDGEVNDETGSCVDIYIGLQGAFSAKRFVSQASSEGGPYRNFEKLRTKLILTTSNHDRANPLAFWSKHVGGYSGLSYMKRFKKLFQSFTWPDEKSQIAKVLKENDKPQRVIVLDVSEIVDGEDAHNDILNEDVAKLILFLLFGHD